MLRAVKSIKTLKVIDRLIKSIASSRDFASDFSPPVSLFAKPTVSIFIFAAFVIVQNNELTGLENDYRSSNRSASRCVKLFTSPERDVLSSRLNTPQESKSGNVFKTRLHIHRKGSDIGRPLNSFEFDAKFVYVDLVTLERI